MRKILFIQCVFGLFFMSGILHAQPLYTLESPNPYYYGFFGLAIGGVGDWNNDGFNDIAVSATHEYSGPTSRYGKAYVFSGIDGGLLDVLEWDEPYSDLGSSLSGGGDLNNDGHEDLLVKGVGGNVPYDPNYFGMVVAFNGQTGEELYHWGGTPNISCCIPGDINGDEYDDVLIGNSGIVYVYSGNGFGLLYSIESPNEPGRGWFGYSMAGVNDVDGDGRVDLLIGADGEDGGAQYAGRAYLFSGASGQLLFTFESAYPNSGGCFGKSVSGSGDVDADGYDDIIVGAPQEDGGALDAGRAYIFSGSTGVLLRTLLSVSPEESGHFGHSVSGIGDANGDGLDDVVVGAPYEDGGAVGAGRAYIFGGTGELLYTLESANPEQAGYYGRSVAGIGDATGDGFPEIAIGAYMEDGGAVNAGRVYVYSGAAVPVELTGFTASVEEGAVVLRWATLSEHENFGFHVYRSRESAGEYMRITEAIIPGAGNSSVRNDYSYSDKNASPGTTCFYKLADIDFQGHETLHGPVSVLVAPLELTLLGASPNPFSETTTLRLNLSAKSHVRLRIYNLAGELVRTLADEEMKAGVFEMMWDGEDESGRMTPSGVYTYRVRSGGTEQFGKAILVR